VQHLVSCIAALDWLVVGCCVLEAIATFHSTLGLIAGNYSSPNSLVPFNMSSSRSLALSLSRSLSRLTWLYRNSFDSCLAQLNSSRQSLLSLAPTIHFDLSLSLSLSLIAEEEFHNCALTHSNSYHTPLIVLWRCVLVGWLFSNSFASLGTCS
jgi:hypothetical protein